jgi:hypothetical protein
MAEDSARGRRSHVRAAFDLDLAARLGKFAPPVPNPESVLGSYSYGYHFDAGLYSAYLRRYAKLAAYVASTHDIVDVQLHAENGFIDSLVLEDGRQSAATCSSIAPDFRDCSSRARSGPASSTGPTGCRAIARSQCLRNRPRT